LRDAFVAISLSSVADIEHALSPDAPLHLPQADPYDERDRIAAELSVILADWTYDDLADAFSRRSIWFQRVQTYDDLRVDPQALHNELFHEVAVGTGTATLVNHPLRYDGGLPPLRHLALKPGAHSAEILAELGLGVAEIADLGARGIITCNSSQTSAQD
jgi:crotonobetainyl-CoA:carnitine CoA-transferase CaiB-like acyl-CoA transferase